MTSRYDIAEYKLIGNANHTSFMGQKECNLSDDFTMGIGVVTYSLVALSESVYSLTILYLKW